MIVKIVYTVEVDDDIRRRIKAHYGEKGLATRKEIQNWFWMYGQSMNDDLQNVVIDEEESESES